MIKFEDIIAFIEKAIRNNLCCHVYKYNTDSFAELLEFKIFNKNTENNINFCFCRDNIIVAGEDYARISIKYELTERKKLILDQMYLNIKEYNERKALNIFDNFFNNKSKDIDLDNDED